MVISLFLNGVCSRQFWEQCHFRAESFGEYSFPAGEKGFLIGLTGYSLGLDGLATLQIFIGWLQ